MRLTDICTLPRAEGTCMEKQSRWYFDQSENRCMPFYYTGCNGNKNNFESRDACESDCPPKIGKSSFLLCTFYNIFFCVKYYSFNNIFFPFFIEYKVVFFNCTTNKEIQL